MEIKQLDSIADGSGRVARLDFIDETGDAVTPLSATWTLTDGNGVTINSRQDVALTPAATVYITLTPADTAYADGDKRFLVAEGPYTSSLTGGQVMIRAGARFGIYDLPEGS